MRCSILVLALLFLSACIPVSEPPKLAAETPSAATQQNVSQSQTAAEEVKVIKCEDTDGTNPKTMGKTILYYSDNTKETINDRCLKEDPTFEIEITCSGLEAKESINKCANGCIKGVCT